MIKKTAPHKFVLGQRVWVYFPKIKVGTSSKLQRRWDGPYYITSELPGNVFLLRRCSDNSQLRSPINAVRLKPFFDPQDRPTNTLPDIPSDVDDVDEDDTDTDVDETADKSDRPASETADESKPGQSVQTTPDPSPPQIADAIEKQTKKDSEDELYEVERLVTSRTQQGKREYKVKWVGYPQTTWEPAENLPEELIRDFHVRKTLQGRSRRRRLRAESPR
jgi:hypothetical protein